MTKIAIIAVYYGKLPEWFRLWIKSCEYNQTIDFLFFTDQEIENTSENIKIYNISFNNLKELIKNKLGMKISLECSYKLCDFKPIYGAIFSDYLKGYDYWGHCDIDLIFGDIRYFLEKYELENYERFLHLGHFSLYKNTEKSNNYFKLSGSKCGDWRIVVSNSRHFAFDEWAGIYGIYKKNNITMFEKRIFADISMIYKRFRLALDDKNYDKQIFYWENGKVYRSYYLDKDLHKEEFIYIHFKKRKMNIFNLERDKTRSFYISSNGFYEKFEKETKLEDIDKYNYFPGKMKEKIELFIFNFKEFIKKIKNKF